MLSRENYEPSWKSPESYRVLASLLGTIAVHHSEVIVDNSTIQRWSDIMALMREVDNIIDDPSQDPHDIHQKLQSFDGFSGSYDSLAPSPNNSDIRERLFATTDKIITIGQSVASAKSISNYTRYRVEEGFATASLFDDSASDSVREQDNFQSNFMPLLRSMGAAACLLDSLKDLPHDHKQGLAKVEPTISNRATLFTSALRYLRPVVPVIKHPSVRHETKKAALSYYGQYLSRVTGTTKEALSTYQ